MNQELIPVDQARAIVESERQLRRAALSSVIDRNPAGKLAHKARVLISQLDQLDYWVEEAGSEDRFVTFLCARIMSGDLMPELCLELGLNEGLAGAFLTGTPSYYERFQAAKAWRAECFVEEMVPISDKSGDPKLRIDTRRTVAGVYNRQRFSDKAQGSAGGNVTVQIMQFGKGESPDVIAARVKGHATSE